MHKSIDKVLESLMADQGITQADLARKTGVGQPTISRILKPNGPKGIKQPADKQVRPIADFFGITTDQLRGYEPLTKPAAALASRPSTPSAAEVVMKMLAQHGSGLTDDARKKITEAAAVTAEIERANNVITVDFSRPGQVGDEVRIAHYDVRAAMGAGQIPHDYPEMLQDVRVSPKHLREMGITFDQHYHLKVITGWGESMTPTIKDRDPLLVDISVREFTGDGIYLFTHEDMLYVKRLQKKGRDRLRRISDNKLHETEEMRVEDTYILARVLYVWNGQKV